MAAGLAEEAANVNGLLEPLLASDKPSQLAAIAALGAFGGAGTKQGPVVAERLKHFALDTDKDVQLAAIAALGAFGGAGTASFLQEMTNDRAVCVRQAAKTALVAALKPRRPQASMDCCGSCTLQ